MSSTVCERLGTPCPDAFLTDEQLRSLAPNHGGRILRVQPETVGPALDAAGPDDIVHLGVGRYEGPLLSRTGAALVGACVLGTEITVAAGSFEDPGLKIEDTGGSVVANLSFSGPRPGLVIQDAGIRVDVRDVWVHDAALGGVVVAEGTAGATIERVAVTGTKEFGEGEGGWGLLITSGEVTVRSVWLAGNDGVGIFALPVGDGPRLVVSLTDAVALGPGRRGIVVENGVHMTLDRVYIDGFQDYGLTATVEDSERITPQLVARNVVVRRVLPRRFDAVSRPLVLARGAAARIDQLLVEECAGAAVYASGETSGHTTSLVLQDVVLLEGRERRPGSHGAGIVLDGDVSARVERAVIANHEGAGILVHGGRPDHTPSLELVDAVIHDIQPLSIGLRGRGIEAQTGAHLVIERVRIVAATEAGVAAFGWGKAPETRVELTDVEVLGTRQAPCGRIPEGEAGSCIRFGNNFGGGTAVWAQGGARIALGRFRLAGSAQAGLLFDDDSVVRASAGEITENKIGIVIPAGHTGDDFPDVFVHGNRLDVSREDLPVPVAYMLGGP